MTDITEKGRPAREAAVALGFFDGLHLGHIEVIKQALNHPEFNSAVLTFNDKTALPKFKERKNIISYDLKTELLSKIGIDYIFAPDFADLRDLWAEEFVDKILIERLNAKFVSCGYDFRFAKGGRSTAEDLAEICKSRGIEAAIVPAVKVDGEPVSSTAIRDLITVGDIRQANRLLGYELTYYLEVTEGKQNGRKIGFPTINQTIPTGMVVPKRGVYKSWTQIKGKNYPSITNVGIKPTIALDAGEKRDMLMETHIIGFNSDLYHQKVRVVLREYMRQEKKFQNLEQLKDQLTEDKKLAMSLRPLY
ncbi:MAG: bifunctional riboflavin kinase/FAD synthetase [[Eubacterium] siraeum]|nr:bifunctional riboflavin kinase/FAD synthetase [[Eubacterium] siraeum]